MTSAFLSALYFYILERKREGEKGMWGGSETHYIEVGSRK
jgi:hypothetical protein